VRTNQFGINRLIIFDLDGVLIDSKEIHFKALNEALATIDIKYQISALDHVKIFDGMNTRDKLNLLSKDYGLPREAHDIIWLKKQEFTEKLLANVGVARAPERCPIWVASLDEACQTADGFSVAHCRRSALRPCKSLLGDNRRMYAVARQQSAAHGP
jgi:phosphoglycolate phosphatase-like HAD superfamily hydrolase